MHPQHAKSLLLMLTTAAALMCVMLTLVCVATQLERLAVERLKIRPECLVGV
jgi:hypothetical protein